MTLRAETLGHYRVYRQRLQEYLHFSQLWAGVSEGQWWPKNDLGHGAPEFASTLRTATLGWLASFVDKRPDSLNVFELWREVFPAQLAEIDRVETAFEPLRAPLKTFRDRVAFHADRQPERQNDARVALLDSALADANSKFLALAIRLLREETSVPELAALQGATA